MSTVTVVKTAVKNYLQSNFPSIETGVLGGAGSPAAVDTVVDSLVMLALNNARKFAELKHDWRFTEVRVRATIPAGGRVLLTSLVDYFDNTTTYDLKSVSKVYRVGEESEELIPMDIVTAKGVAVRKKDEADLGMWVDDDMRYRGDLPTDSGSRLNKVVHFGNGLYLEPKADTNTEIVIDGQRWLADYTLGTDTDFFLQRGTAFMLFSAMCEANYLIKAWAPRQEGNVSPPVNDRDLQLITLIDWDNYAAEGSVDHDLA